MCISSSSNMEKQTQWRRKSERPLPAFRLETSHGRHPGEYRWKMTLSGQSRSSRPAAPAGAGSFSCLTVCPSHLEEALHTAQVKRWTPTAPVCNSTSEFANHSSHLIHIWPYDYCHLENVEYGMLQMGKQTKTSNYQLVKNKPELCLNGHR